MSTKTFFFHSRSKVHDGIIYIDY